MCENIKKTKTFWNNLKYSEKLVKELIKCAEKKAEREVKPSKYQRKDECHEKSEYLRRVFGFTLSPDKSSLKIYRGEEAIERVVVAKNTDLWNQFNLGDGGKENIDLVRADSDGKILEIYELKREGSKDTPIYALYEVLKNYYLIKKFKDIELEEPLNLTILAPNEYFKCYEKSKNSMDEFYKIIKCLNKNREFNIELKTLDLTSEKILDKIKSLKYEAGKLTPDQVKKIPSEPFMIKKYERKK